MHVDVLRCAWMFVDAGGNVWIQLDLVGCFWVHLDAQLDAFRCRWMVWMVQEMLIMDVFEGMWMYNMRTCLDACGC